jgi:hypothetical protein
METHGDIRDDYDGDGGVIRKEENSAELRKKRSRYTELLWRNHCC